MFITVQGPTLFQIQDQKKQPKANLAIGSFSDPKNDFIALTKLKAAFDIILVTQNKLVPPGFPKLKGKPFLINTPGEFEIKGAEIKGIQDETNIIYVFSLNSIRAAFVSEIKKKELSSGLIGAIEGIDILFITLRGDEITPQYVAKIISQVEPKMVIPMNFSSSDLKEFFTIVGVDPIEPIPNLDIKSVDLLTEKLEVRILLSQNELS
jgi:hypothetical protein